MRFCRPLDVLVYIFSHIWVYLCASVPTISKIFRFSSLYAWKNYFRKYFCIKIQYWFLCMSFFMLWLLCPAHDFVLVRGPTFSVAHMFVIFFKLHNCSVVCAFLKFRLSCLWLCMGNCIISDLFLRVVLWFDEFDIES